MRCFVIGMAVEMGVGCALGRSMLLSEEVECWSVGEVAGWVRSLMGPLAPLCHCVCVCVTSL